MNLKPHSCPFLMPIRLHPHAGPGAVCGNGFFLFMHQDFRVGMTSLIDMSACIDSGSPLQIRLLSNDIDKNIFGYVGFFVS